MVSRLKTKNIYHYKSIDSVSINGKVHPKIQGHQGPNPFPTPKPNP